jgi:hypothetical protein
VVARFEVLIFRPKKARRRHIFEGDLLAMLAQEYEEEAPTEGPRGLLAEIGGRRAEFVPDPRWAGNEYQDGGGKQASHPDEP